MTHMPEDVQVLEFRLGSNEYCIDIEYIEEVVELGGNGLTDLPNSASYIEGVMDLRGDTTTIVNPKKLLDVGAEEDGDRIIVLEQNGGSDDVVGWQVDEVNEVSTVDPDSVDTPTGDDNMINGVINKEEEFVIWVEP